MKEKKSFVIYCDWENTFRKISKYEAGDLIQGIFEYMRTGEAPQFESFAVEAIFTLMVETFKRDRDKYYKMCERNANNIAKRWDKDGKSAVNNSSKNTTGKNGIKENTGNTDNDNDNDNDNVNDNDNENVNDNDNDNDKNYILSISSSSEMRGSECSASYSDDFLEFWSAYPRKTGKGAAYKVFNKLKLTKKEKADILSSIEWQKRSDQWLRDNGQFIPYPATYLNQRRWEDEPQKALCGDITDPNRYTEDEEDDFDFTININSN